MKILPFTLAAYAVLAQAQAPTEPARLVRLSVVAVESNGQPATGLTAADFQISDQGKAQHITLFHGPTVQSPVSGSHEVANRPAAGTHTTAILFDFLNQNRVERLDAVRKMGPSLKQLESGSALYMYLLAPDGKLEPMHEIPAGAAGASDGAWIREIETLLANVNKNQNKTRPAGMGDEDVVKKTYVALETVANQLAAFPGRKDIIWVTSGIPNVWNPKTPCNGDWIDCALYVPHLSVTLDRAGVVVNPFSYASLNVNQSRSMDEMATLTGGRAYFAEDMAATLKQVGEQSRATYTIAYDPSSDNWDSKFHKVKVSCERKGVKVQAKQRYYAVPDQRAALVRQQAILVGAFQSPNDVSEIGLRVAVTRAAAPNTVKVEMRIDPADLRLQERGGQFSAPLTVLFSARTATAPQGEPLVGALEAQLSREQLDAAMKDGVPISKEYAINSATEKVRLIVMDRATDSVGSLTVPLGK